MKKKLESSFSSNRIAPMSSDEVARKVALEKIVAANVDAFMACGAALYAIGYEQLFAGHGTWEDYCADTWKISVRRAENKVRPEVTSQKNELCSPPHI